MKAVILAAGVGARLGVLVKNKPKCMLKITDTRTILDDLIEKLNEIDLESINIVTGYMSKIVEKKYKNNNIKIIYNEKYKEYNNIYSFYILKEHIIKEDILLINSDVILKENIFKKLDYKDSFMVIDNMKKLGEEEMKVIINNNIVIDVGKNINNNKASGEYIGVLYLKNNDLKIVLDEAGRMIKRGLTTEWYESSIQRTLTKVKIIPKYINTPWIEVDDAKDYKKALSLFGK
jgi:choline kinase